MKTLLYTTITLDVIGECEVTGYAYFSRGRSEPGGGPPIEPDESGIEIEKITGPNGKEIGEHELTKDQFYAVATALAETEPDEPDYEEPDYPDDY